MRTGARVNMPRHLQHRRPLLERVSHVAAVAAVAVAWGLAMAGLIR